MRSAGSFVDTLKNTVDRLAQVIGKWMLELGFAKALHVDLETVAV